MTSTLLKLLSLALAVTLQAGCRPNSAHQTQKNDDGSTTFKFNPEEKYGPAAPQSPPRQANGNPKSEKK
ncbi:hypothetical protein [Duganella sp. HH105]|uniref:hypothetical protein n=1 Tax=Duganella sp. HH105 TaxID=1781067 RepID=UPI00143A47C0|nr:hypothetical protein [Duganella sp. HH105]